MKQWISVPGSDSLPVNSSVLGVLLDDGERVKWAYTILPDGRRIVTGYDIMPILPQKSNDLPENG
jgi:hypothetical protein